MINWLKSLPIADYWIRRNPFFYGRYRRALNNTPSNLDSLRSLKLKLLNKILKTSYKTRFYKAYSVQKQIDLIPKLNKADIVERPEDFLTVPSVFLIKASTSGTSGTPLKLFRSYPSIVFEQAAIDHLILLKSGQELSKMKVAYFMGHANNPNDNSLWKKNTKRRISMFSSKISNETVESYYNALIDFEIDALYGYPSSLSHLAKFFKEQNLSLKMKAVITSSEMLYMHERILIEEVFKTKVIDYYGQAERVALAHSVDGCNYYFLSRYGAVQLDHSYDDGDYSYYEVIATSYFNKSMILLKYVTGDMALLPKNISSEVIEQIELGINPFLGIVGRKGDTLTGINGENIVGIDHIPRNIENIIRLQVLQKKDLSVEIRVLPKSNFGEKDKIAIMENARMKIPAQIEVTIVIKELFVTTSGKSPFVVKFY